MQNTLKSAVTFKGLGLHSGRPVLMKVLPASADYGIWFKRVDLPAAQAMIAARWDQVVPSRLCTLLRNDAGAEVSTVEHIMAALAGCGIHNAVIEIDGPEVPILDGSAVPFVEAFIARGLTEQMSPVRAIRVLMAPMPPEAPAGGRGLGGLKPLAWGGPSAVTGDQPADMLEIDFRIDFAEPAIGRQEKRLNLANGTFVRELCDSRTFCRQADVDLMRANGLALGGSLENAVVFEGERVLSPGGLRHKDEPVRHKMLDAMGDLYLAGGPVLGRYTGLRAGHALTNRLLHALFADPSAWRMVECSPQTVGKLPGVGVLRSDLPATA